MEIPSDTSAPEAAALATLSATGLLDVTPEESFDRLSRLASKALRAPLVLISFVDGPRQLIKSAHGLPEDSPIKKDFPLSRSFCNETMKSGAPFFVEDARNHPLVLENRVDWDPRFGAYAGAPLRMNHGQQLGTLCVYDRAARAWQSEDIEMLSEIAQSVVTEIELQMTMRDLRAGETRFRRLADAAFEGIAISEYGVVLDTNQALADMFGYETYEMLGMTLDSLLSCDDYDVTSTRESPNVAPIYENIGVRKGGEHFPFEARARRIVFRGRALRIDAVRDITERKRTETLLASQAEELRSLSLRDELTGLYNRRGFLELARQQLKIANRTDRVPGLYFADLNGMKLINDMLGHEEGDHALVDAAALFRETFRDSDIIARLGGDEFVVLALDLSLEHSEKLLTRVRQRIEIFNDLGTRPYRLSISIGVALYDHAKFPTVEALLVQADSLMYDQKKMRRLKDPTSAPTIRISNDSAFSHVPKKTPA